MLRFFFVFVTFSPFTFRYPRYKFLHDRNISSSAAVKSRYNEQSLRGILKDIYSLVRCDFVVCTFSSQVGPLTVPMNHFAW